jgi:protein SCO1/2
MTSRAARLVLVSLVLVAVAFVAGVAAPARAFAGGFGGEPQAVGMPQQQNIPALVDIEIKDKRGAKVARELTFTDQDGQPVRMGDYLDGKHPVIVVLAYYECPMLCTVVLNGLLTGVKSLGDFKVGKDFRVVVVSFDHRDTAESAARKRKVYLDAYGKDVGKRGWDFLVGSPEQVRQLADTLGFPYRWDPVGKQFAHSAGAFLLTAQGELSQTLYGIEFPRRDLEFALMDASQGKLGSTWQKVLLRCFHWDPDARSYRPKMAMLTMKIGGLVMVVLMWFAFLYFRRMEQKRRRSHMEPVNVRT